jgi:protein phosphatase
VGLVRRANEDSYLLRPDLGLFVVSDGMGGHNAGAEASAFVVANLPDLVGERLPGEGAALDEVASAFSSAVTDLSALLRQEADSKASLSGMGATLVTVLVRQGHLFVAHLGDSRCYRLRQGQLTTLTHDHSVAAMLLREGQISALEARFHPGKSMLARYVGMDGLVEPDTSIFPIEAGDRLLLCSDGLWGQMEESELLATLKENPEPEPCCKQLVALALANGGHDNITALQINLAG